MQYIGKLDKNKMGKYKEKMIIDEVVLTDERLNNHILIYHLKEYEQLKRYLQEIVQNPDIIIEDNKNENTLIFLKEIPQIQKRGRIENGLKH